MLFCTSLWISAILARSGLPSSINDCHNRMLHGSLSLIEQSTHSPLQPYPSRSPSYLFIHFSSFDHIVPLPSFGLCCRSAHLSIAMALSARSYLFFLALSFRYPWKYLPTCRLAAPNKAIHQASSSREGLPFTQHSHTPSSHCG